MSINSPTLFRQALRDCGELEGERVIECLQSFLGEDGGSPRTLRETLLRSLGVHVISVASYGHLMSMQGVTCAGSTRTAALLVVFFFFPELAIAQLILRTANAIAQVPWKRRIHLRYWIARCLGTHVSVSGSPVPLSDVNADQVRSVRQKYNLIWFSRCAVLTLLLVQYVGSVGLWYRFCWVWERYVVDAHILARNYHMALGGLVAVFNSILIASSNLQWQHIADDIASTQYSLQLSHVSELSTSDVEAPRVTASPLQEDKNEVHIRNLPKIWLAIDVGFRRWLDCWFPEIYHHTTESAIIAHVLATYVNNLHGTLKPSHDPLALTNLLLSKPSHYVQNSEELWTAHGTIFASAAYTSLFQPSMSRDGTYYTLLSNLTTLLMVSVPTRLILRSKWLRKCAPSVEATCMFFDKWIASGRSLISFPWFVLVVLLSAWEILGTFIRAVQIDVAVARMLREGTPLDRLHLSAYLYKDPWYDDMYIL